MQYDMNVPSVLDDSKHSKMTSTCSIIGDSSINGSVRTPIRQDARLDDGCIQKLGETMLETLSLSPLSSPTPSLASVSSGSRGKRVRFDRDVHVREVPSLESLSLEERRRVWWTGVEVCMIERDVCYIANLIDLNRLPESKSTFAHVRGAVAYTDNALRTRSMQRDQLYQEVSAIQRSHIEDPRVDSFERAAKQSLKRMLIAKLCQNITETSKRHAEEIARLDAEQADFVYQEAFEDAIGLVDTSDYRNRALSEENYVSFKASDPSTRSPAALSILPNE